MSVQREDVFNLYAESLALPAGVTAVIPSVQGQIGAILKYVSGGSIQIIGASNALGSTYGINRLYLLGTTEILNVNMCGPMYLIATGSTCVVNLLRLTSASKNDGTY